MYIILEIDPKTFCMWKITFLIFKWKYNIAYMSKVFYEWMNNFFRSQNTKGILKIQTSDFWRKYGELKTSSQKLSQWPWQRPKNQWVNHYSGTSPDKERTRDRSNVFWIAALHKQIGGQWFSTGLNARE